MKWYVILIIGLCFISVVYGGSYMDYVTIGLGDNRWCQLTGCNFTGSVYAQDWLLWNGSSCCGGGGGGGTCECGFTDVDEVYIYNNSGTITFNETKLNLTIDLRDDDTIFNPSTIDYVNQTMLDNGTIIRNQNTSWLDNWYNGVGYYTYTNFTSNYATMGSYTTTNFSTDYYGITSRYDSSNFTSDYYAITSRYDRDNFTSDYATMGAYTTTNHSTETHAYIGNCSGANCDIGWGNLTSVPAGFADGVDDTGGGNISAEHDQSLNTTDTVSFARVNTYQINATRGNFTIISAFNGTFGMIFNSTTVIVGYIGDLI